MSRAKKRKERLNAIKNPFLRGTAKTFSVLLRVIGWTLFIIALFIAVSIFFLIKEYYPKYLQYKEKAYAILSNIDENSFTHTGNTLIYDKDGLLLGKLGNEEYEYIEIKDIPEHIKDGYVATEDKNFATHNGVDYKAILRAAIAYVKNKGKITQGGSTITMQVVKNNLLSNERTFDRKVLEALLSREIEKQFSKSEIMEIYCNTNYYGCNCYGVAAAGRYYFGHEPSELTLSECATLVGVSNSPSKINPVANYNAAITKRNSVLLKMMEAGYITKEEYILTASEKLNIVAKGSHTESDSYVINYAIRSAVLDLMRQEGFNFKYTFSSKEEYDEYYAKYNEAFTRKNKEIRSGGYEIYTSINREAQNLLQTAVTEELAGFSEVKEDGIFDMQGAAVSIDNKTGLVIAIVGGRENTGQYNRAYLSERQPGSSIKPLLDYGPALNEARVTPGTVMVDEPTDVNGYAPENADKEYHGEVTVREALARSLNTIALQLFNDTGAKTCLSYLDKMRFSSLSYSDTNNAALSIGGFTTGTRVVDMARGYAGIANGGKMRTSDCIVKITTAGETLYDYTKDSKEEQIFTAATAFMLQDMLQGVLRENYGTGHVDAILGQYYAGKTGTTDDHKDGWFCGFSPYYTTCVWTGYDNPKEIPDLGGGTYPVNIWNRYMQTMHEGLEQIPYNVPNTVALSNGQNQLDVVPYGDIYGSRPTGYDYIPVQSEEELARAAEERSQAEAVANIEALVVQYEQTVIDSTEKAKNIDNDYYAILANTLSIQDTAKAKELRERCAVKHDKLKAEFESSWKALIEAEEMDKKLREESEIYSQNLQEATAAREKAHILTAQRIKNISSSILSASTYSEGLDQLYEAGEEALALCVEYDDYDELKEQLDLAKNHLTNLKGNNITKISGGDGYTTVTIGDKSQSNSTNNSDNSTDNYTVINIDGNKQNQTSNTTSNQTSKDSNTNNSTNNGYTKVEFH